MRRITLPSKTIFNIALSYSIIFWFLLFSTRGSDQAPAISEASSNTNIWNQIIWISLFALTFLNVFQEREISLSFLSTPILMLALYLIIAGFSTIWAISPDVSFKRLLQQIIVVSVICVNAAKFDDKTALIKSVTFIFAICVILNFCLYPLIPPTSLGYAGIFPQKNNLGAVCGIAFCLSAVSLLFASSGLRIFHAAVLLVSSFLLVVSQSKTSLGLAFIAPCLGFVLCQISRILSIRPSALIITFVASIAAMAVLASQTSNLGLDDVSKALFGDTTFTGRATIWNFVDRFIERRPIFGYGYQSFWSIGDDAPNLRLNNFVSSLNQSHNGYRDIMLETGILGLVIFCSSIFFIIVSMEREVPQNSFVMTISLSALIFSVLHNMLESSFTRGFSVVWIFSLTLYGASTLRPRK